MRVKKEHKKLKIAGLILLATAMLLVCHAAYSPYQLLPSGFRWALYPVALEGEDTALERGNMAVVDKNARLEPGALVAWISASSDNTPLCFFGRVLRSEGGLHTIRLDLNGETLEINAYSSQRVVLRIRGLGALVLFLHANRVAVWVICLALALGYAVYRGATHNRRRLMRSREEYMRLFDQYGSQFDEEEDF